MTHRDIGDSYRLAKYRMKIFASLHNAINRLIKTIEAFEENDISNLVRRKTFDLKVVTDHFEKAMSSLPAKAPGEVDGEVHSQLLQNCHRHMSTNSNRIETKIGVHSEQAGFSLGQSKQSK